MRRSSRGDVVDAVAGLKAGSENLVVYGSGQLTETLRAAGLIDEYRLLICPIVLGEGRKLFKAPPRASSPLPTAAAHRREWRC